MRPLQHHPQWMRRTITRADCPPEVNIATNHQDLCWKCPTKTEFKAYFIHTGLHNILLKSGKIKMGIIIIINYCY